MLKRTVSFDDFDGNPCTEEFYFNLTQSELVELQVSAEGGMEALMQRIIKAKDYDTLMREFKRIILLAYGEKSHDGKRFIKTEQMREEFSQSAAYNSLFMELISDTTAAAAFMRSVVPKQVQDAINVADQQLQSQPQPFLPPVPPIGNQ